MKNNRLTELELEYFRGATQRTAIKFDNSKPLIIVFGENGTGKSTLVDGMDLIANKTVGSLKDRSSTSESKHAPSIKKKTKDIKVSLHRGSDEWKGSYTGSKVCITPTENIPVIEILRRSQLLKLIESPPSKRYGIIQYFIDVRGIEASEAALGKAATETNKELEQVIQDKQDSEEQLIEIWESNNSQGDSWEEWVKEKAAIKTEDLGEDINHLEEILSKIKDFNTRNCDYLSAIDLLVKAQSNLTVVDNELNTSQEEWTAQTPHIIDTLEATDKLLKEGWDKNACPVCKKENTVGELQEEVSKSLDVIKALKLLHSKKQGVDREVEVAESSIQQETTKLIKACNELLKIIQQKPLDEITELELDFPQLENTLSKDNLTQSKLEDTILEFQKLVDLGSLFSTTQDQLQQDKGQLNVITNSYNRYNEANERTLPLAEILKRLELTKTIVREHRINFIQNILKLVSDKAHHLYERIHPDEEIKSGRLELDTNKRGSLMQYAEFAGEADIEPQGFFSDSHLDTLGFCYWLALAKLENPEDKIIVLDDVFTSVDAAHIHRIVELLDTECHNFSQLFIFTHNRSWRDKYRFNQAASNKVQLIELRRWTPNRGVSHDKSKPEIEEIQSLLTEFSEGGSSLQRQEIASRCGILLEALLTHLSMQYRCMVPHTPDSSYTLGDLLSGCGKLMKVLKVQRLDENHLNGDETILPEAVSPKPEFDVLKEMSYIRNQIGCHFNLSGAGLSDVEVEEFGNATLLFARLVVCDHCGEIPRADKSTHRKCSCHPEEEKTQTRLIPAKM